MVFEAILSEELDVSNSFMVKTLVIREHNLHIFVLFGIASFQEVAR
jgi:hypothetical protein